MQIEVTARKREAQGTGASRRLRNSGSTPGIVYGGKDPAVAIEIEHQKLWRRSMPRF
jgi:large subunit ribosomal protein L25